MDSNSRSPVSGDTPQRPLITSLAIIFPQSSASPSHRRLRPRRGKILAPSRCMPLVRSMLEAQEAVGGGQELVLARSRRSPAPESQPVWDFVQLQIVYGLLCAADGCPVAVEVFEGNTADPICPSCRRGNSQSAPARSTVPRPGTTRGHRERAPPL
jgi:hypothetical protein